MAKALEKPEILRTDKMEIRIYLRSREVAFHPLMIHLGQIIPSKLAKFRLKAKDFDSFPNSWHRLLVIMETMVSPPLDFKSRQVMEMPSRDYLQQRHVIE
jgi:hypothetical protein